MSSDLHAAIMNLPAQPGLAMANATDNQLLFYKLGHRDARHAAAELAAAREAEVQRLREALAAIVDFCDDPNGSDKGESLALGLARLLPTARAALTQPTNKEQAS